jgi:glutamyl-tRNA reductase
MRIEAIGINHRTSGLEVRDRAAIGPQQAAQAYEALLASDNIEGAVILSTCNRTEVYLSPYTHHEEEELIRLFATLTGLTPEEAEAAFILRDEAAVDHLFRVAAGLDSQMLGEVQILGQVKEALEKAQEQQAANPVLNKLWGRAVEAGKAARHRTQISQGSVSVASASVEMAQRIFGSLENIKVLLVGAGETSRLAARHLQSAGVAGWRISNRTAANARAVADLLGGEVASFPPSSADLAWADLVVSATGADQPVLTLAELKRARRTRRGMQLLLDLAVPRDMEPSIARLDDTYLYTVDDFQELVAANLAAREKEAARAGRLVDRMVEEFAEWYRENRVAPTIQQLQVVLEDLRRQEVERNAGRFAESDREQVDRFSRSLMRKVTSLIIANLKRSAVEEDDLTTARALTLALASENRREDINDVLEKLDHELSH